MLTRPLFIPADIAAAPLDFRWSESISLGILDPPPTRLSRLASRYAPLHPLAAFAVLLGTFEWIMWRFEHHADLDDMRRLAQAGYAALIDPRYARLDEFEEPEDSDASQVLGPLVTAACLLCEGFEFLASGDDRVKQSAFCMALLARHVTANDAALESWLAATLKAFTVQFPDAQDTAGPTLAREALEPAADLDEASMRAGQARLRDTLEPARNRYLASAAAMKRNGYAGAPYRARGLA